MLTGNEVFGGGDLFFCPIVFPPRRTSCPSRAAGGTHYRRIFRSGKVAYIVTRKP